MGIGYSSFFVLSDGKVKSTGYNYYGQLGNNTVDSSNGILQDVALDISDNIKEISTGMYHTMFLMRDGTVKVVGSNNYGQLGLGHKLQNQWMIQSIRGLNGVKQIACGSDHTIFLMDDGSVKVVGGNTSGQLGLGHKNDVVNLTSMAVGSNGVKQIACGYAHTMFLMNNGTVKACGDNGYGQLGIGNATGQSFIQTLSISGVKQIACGQNYTMFLMEDGTVKATGQNGSYQLGLGNSVSQTAIQSVPITGVKQVSCGSDHTMFLMQDGTVKSVGLNNYGQLGLGNTITPRSSIQTLLLKNVKQVMCGSNHSIFLMYDGTVKSSGVNNNGELGTGDTINANGMLKDVSAVGVKSLNSLLIEGIKKFLLSDGIKVFNMENGLWNNVGDVPVSASMFIEKGILDLKVLTTSKLPELLNPILLVWSEEKGMPPNLKTTGLLKSKMIKGKVDIALSSLKSVRVVASTTGTVRILLSSDSGVTWKGKQAVDITKLNDVKQYGFTPTELNALTEAQLAALTPNKQIRFAYYFEQASSADIASVSAMYVNEVKYTGTPNVGAINLANSLAKMDIPLIELKDNDGAWNPVEPDEMVYAKKGKEWNELQLRIKMKDDQGLNAIAYSWS